MIKVCFCATRNLYDKLAIVLTSLWHHNPDAFVYLILEDNEFPFFKSPQMKVINITDLDLDIRETNPNLNTQCTYMTLIRAYLPLILFDEPKVISIDCDMIINGDLEGVWNWDMRENYIACVPEYSKHFLDMEPKYNDPYVNTGFIIMDLDLMRKHHISELISDLLNVRYLPKAEQDAFNYLCKDKIMLLPQIYNSTIYTGIVLKPIIFHGTPTKPWENKESNFLYPVWQYYEEMYERVYLAIDSGEDSSEELSDGD